MPVHAGKRILDDNTGNSGGVRVLPSLSGAGGHASPNHWHCQATAYASSTMVPETYACTGTAFSPSTSACVKPTAASGSSPPGTYGAPDSVVHADACVSVDRPATDSVATLSIASVTGINDDHAGGMGNGSQSPGGLPGPARSSQRVQVFSRY